MSFDTKNLIRKFSEEPKSVHYKAPIDKGVVTEPEGEKPAWPFRKITKEDLPEFKVKSVTDKESYDMIYKAGGMDILNKAQLFMMEYMNNHPEDQPINPFKLYNKFGQWVEDQRKTLNSYL